MKYIIRHFALAGIIWCCPSPMQAGATEPPRPRLQFINGSTQQIDVFWLKSDAERVPNGSVAPGGQTTVDTSIGHRFAVIGRGDKSETVVTSQVPVQTCRAGGVPGFYAQRIDAHGYPIVASTNVNPFALKEAAFIVDNMLSQRPDVRDAMIKSGSRLCIIAWNEFTTELPEWAWLAREPVEDFPDLSPRDYRDARARGMGGSQSDPYCSCAEENVLGYPGDPYAAECILIHEFAHNIHLRGMVNVDPTFDARLKAAYDAAMKAGLWKGKYAAVNYHEYFAEGVQSWFDNNRVNDHDHNHVHLRKQLIEYDPGLAALCREVFGETELHYTKPQTRLAGHLAGYEPAKAPTFQWPDRLKKAKEAIRSRALARDAAGTYATRVVAGWQVHVHRDLIDAERADTEHALELLGKMLNDIVRLVPAPAVAELKKVPLYFTPAHRPGSSRAEFHPAADWLREHGRDPAMARGIEFSGVSDFEAEMNRMPNFALHELAHAYHHRVLQGGFDNAQIKSAFERAASSGTYARVERWHGNGRPNSHERAYAMTDPMEYFAESTEAYFSRNDFFPFTRDDLKAHDPAMCKLLAELWGVKDAP